MEAIDTVERDKRSAREANKARLPIVTTDQDAGAKEMSRKHKIVYHGEYKGCNADQLNIDRLRSLSKEVEQLEQSNEMGGL